MGKGNESALAVWLHLRMTLSLWLAFVAASSILLIIPGPTVLLVVSYALGQGWRTALPMVVGVALGDFAAMTLSMLGHGLARGRAFPRSSGASPSRCSCAGRRSRAR